MLRRHAITRRRYAKCEIIGGRIRESKCFLFHSFRSSLLSFLFFRVINVSLPLWFLLLLPRVIKPIVIDQSEELINFLFALRCTGNIVSKPRRDTAEKKTLSRLSI